MCDQKNKRRTLYKPWSWWCCKTDLPGIGFQPKLINKPGKSHYLEQFIRTLKPVQKRTCAVWDQGTSPTTMHSGISSFGAEKTPCFSRSSDRRNDKLKLSGWFLRCIGRFSLCDDGGTGQVHRVTLAVAIESANWLFVSVACTLPFRLGLTSFLKMLLCRFCALLFVYCRLVFLS